MTGNNGNRQVPGGKAAERAEATGANGQPTGGG